jgi:hypothetical protein
MPVLFPGRSRRAEGVTETPARRGASRLDAGAARLGGACCPGGGRGGTHCVGCIAGHDRDAQVDIPFAVPCLAHFAAAEVLPRTASAV